MQRIAIIGGGAAGSAVVAELLRSAADFDDTPGCALTWVVGDRAPGRGVAYATGDDQHLLNVRAANMGLFADRPGDFLDHLLARGIAAEGSQFLPRALYGDYVEATLAHLLTTTRRRVTLAARSTEAVAIRPLADERFAVRLREGEELRVDGVVLAPGALPPAPLAGVSESALRSGAYAADPWQWPALADDPGHVLVVGTGLTAVDVLLAAAARWPQARLTAVSRHGRLPATHAERPGPAYAGQAALLDRLRALPPRARAWLRDVRAALREPDTDWRSVLDALRPETQRLWQRLDLHERARFLRHLRSAWEVARHRLPPQTAAAIQRLRDGGRLHVLAARVRGVDGHGPLLARLQPRGSGHARPLTVAADFIVQATGLESGATGTAHALTRQLVEDGLVRADPLGLGLAAQPDGRLLRPDGGTWNGLRAIGTLLRGSLWECTGMPEIRALARDIARDLPLAVRAQPRRARVA
jgi:uncharacterized NAD(P)/FAD-binding protein YdhS